MKINIRPRKLMLIVPISGKLKYISSARQRRVERLCKLLWEYWWYTYLTWKWETFRFLKTYFLDTYTTINKFRANGAKCEWSERSYSSRNYVVSDICHFRTNIDLITKKNFQTQGIGPAISGSPFTVLKQIKILVGCIWRS